MAWDVAKSLDQLLAQINAKAPNRSKKSDGSVGDLAHQAGKSEHNPENKPGNEPDEVDARDFTHDPANGADMNVIAEALRVSRDRRILYVIFNRRYFSPRTGWKWVDYHGDNPHDKHMHVSVNDVDDDNTAPWDIGGEDDELSKQASDSIVWEIRPWAASTLHATGRIEVQLAAMQKTLDALAVVVKAGGGDLDTAAILNRINEVAAAESSLVLDLQQQLADRDRRLAEALAQTDAP